ncbi:cobaltochelatase subunit CobN [Eionea flava]
MHLLAAQPGGFTDDEGIIDLGQSPGDIVLLSAADSTLAGLANVAESLPPHYPAVRLANWMQLLKPAALDLYRDKVLDHAKIVIVSLLGGESYWQYGVEQLCQWATEKNHDHQRQLIIIPGDDTPDEQVFSLSTVERNISVNVWRYLREGGTTNLQHLYYFLADQLIKTGDEWENHWAEPRALPRCSLYFSTKLFSTTCTSIPSSSTRSSSIPTSKKSTPRLTFDDWLDHWDKPKENQTEKNTTPVCAIIFYRSHLQSANTTMFDKLISTVAEYNLRPLPIAVNSLKDTASLNLINDWLARSQTHLIINTTGFASHTVSSPDLSSEPSQFSSPFDRNIPVLQCILSSSTIDDWHSYSQGLRSRDIAMQVVLPEMDGRIITRAISFKAEAYFSERCEISVVRYALHQERAQFVAQLAQAYTRLATKKNNEKRIAFILANYPTKDGRIGNGVGLDTPASTIALLNALKTSGYPIDNIPNDGNALITELLGAVTNNPNTLHQRPCWQSMSLSDYAHYFSKLPDDCQQAVVERWGTPESDPKYRNGRIMLAGIRLGETFIGIQPARGFNQDLLANYHDPDLVPPHSYLAFYFWLRHCYQVDAVVHVGKHGNLEWLPGKGVALADTCWPDIALGPMPHFYPFIVNDPGEGAQAKRRTHAAIIDHLMPPMTRADTYGAMAELEGLVDEYYQALGMDTRREEWLRNEILRLVNDTHLREELPIADNSADDEQAVLSSLDTYLCDIKEAQIRHGLHILGALPNTEKLTDTMVALLRLPRSTSTADSVNSQIHQQHVSTAYSQGILHNLVRDLTLSINKSGELFDPLTASVDAWLGDKPSLLANVSSESWRTSADTRERLEILAALCVRYYVLGDTHSINTDSSGNTNDTDTIEALLLTLPQALPTTFLQLDYAKSTLLSALEKSAEQEISALLNGLKGEFIPPGPSGAPTRGRLDTLPTGRNFFSVDNRSIPSPAAWAIGQQSAQALIERHLQEHGDYPKQLGLSVWGTATMRTGGDDIAQAFALMGIKPIWAAGSQRVVDFEIMPSMLMNRPRVDVTLRVSGFFRDAFPNVIALFDAAVLALAELDEPAQANTIRQHIEKDQQHYIDGGTEPSLAQRHASYRVFGSKPGAYGAGLQGLIDERCWENADDLAEAYINWGGYAYGRSINHNVHADNHPSAPNSLSGGIEGVAVKAVFEQRLRQIDTIAHNQDNREHDLLDSDDYYQFQGGMTNAVTTLSGTTPTVYHNDHSNPSKPVVRTLKEELNRVIRSRLLNPKWIKAMREHGYKGAFEMAASVDYLFAYDATTHMIDDYQYEQVANALVFDPDNRAFMEANNPSALEEMAERLLEATQRGLWENDNGYGEKLQNLLLDIDAQQETPSQ